HPNAHIVVLDPHNEYATAFGDIAEVIDVNNLQMPFWFFDLAEAVRILVRGGTAQEQEAQAIILKDAITRARRHYAGDDPAAASLACRVIFDFVLWSRPGQVPPLLLACEEAHRYVPADEEAGFGAAARAITRIAKEGRKYGIALGLISQRPAELSPTALSQC